VAEEQFGVFESWTQAMAFARELNQGLDIHPDDVRQILTSAYLARQEVLRAAEERAPGRTPEAPIAAFPSAVEVAFLFAQIHLAETFCRQAAAGPRSSCTRLLLQALQTREFVLSILSRRQADEGAQREVLKCIQLLDASLQSVSSTFSGGAFPDDQSPKNTFG
jgi:hypothetical protein